MSPPVNAELCSSVEDVFGLLSQPCRMSAEILKGRFSNLPAEMPPSEDSAKERDGMATTQSAHAVTWEICLKLKWVFMGNYGFELN
jgi:hypothetical protein